MQGFQPGTSTVTCLTQHHVFQILTSNMMIGYMYLSAFNQNATNVGNGVLVRKEQKLNTQWLFFSFQ